MKNKFVSIAFLSLLLVFGFGSFGVAEAQVSSFQLGCTSVFGYSTVNGLPCNGTSVASTTFFPGCTSIMGFSTMTGLPCNGGTVATTAFLLGCSSTLGSSISTGLPCSGGPTPLPFLSGCSSIFGYSTINNQPCNGTAVASFNTFPPIFTGTPGLPTTGAGGNSANNLIMLVSSGLVAMLGLTYLARSKKLSA